MLSLVTIVYISSIYVFTLLSCLIHYVLSSHLFHCCCCVASLPAVYVRVTWHVYFQIMHHLWKKHVSGPPVCNAATNRRATAPLLTPPQHGRGLLLTGITVGLGFVLFAGQFGGKLYLSVEEEEAEGGWVSMATAASIETCVEEIIWAILRHGAAVSSLWPVHRRQLSPVWETPPRQL